MVSKSCVLCAGVAGRRYSALWLCKSATPHQKKGNHGKNLKIEVLAFIKIGTSTTHPD